MLASPVKRTILLWALLCAFLLALTGLLLWQSEPATPSTATLSLPTPVAQLSLDAPRRPTAAVPTPASAQSSTQPSARTISGSVLGSDGPIADARVRVQLLGEYVLSAEDGTFALADVRSNGPITLTAWAPGHYIGATVIETGGEGDDATGNVRAEIQLNPHYTTDNFEYDWFEEDGVEGSAACGTCHTAYTEWQEDAHGGAASNYRFFTLYSGTDVNDNKSPNTTFTSQGTLAPPDLDAPYYGPGFKLDNPERAGNCATCHTPMAAKLPTSDGCSWSGCHSSTVAQYSDEIQPGASPRYMLGDANEGISCEFCHKIGDVLLNEETGLPHSDSPGLLSLELHRPEAGHDLFYGPLDDVMRTDIPEARDSYLPLQSESEFCAACHYGVLGGVVGPRAMTGGVEVYSSYAEWLESDYSDPQTGQTCQNCHMPRVKYDRFVFPEKGGRARDYYEISNHHMLGGGDVDFLRSAVTMTTTASLEGDALRVTVDITNDGAGHHVPTGTPLRHLLLVVTATDGEGNPLPQAEGATLPDWAGDHAGRAGKTFAKVVRDVSTGEAPTAAYWREIELVEDTRIPARATDRSDYTFTMEAPAAGVEVRLLYRRAYQQVMEWKAWPDADIAMAESSLRIER